tara:strand:- start:173 stop:391 length:219 start_codon:yes stop_codon:yes gene_type:complete
LNIGDATEAQMVDHFRQFGFVIGRQVVKSETGQRYQFVGIRGRFVLLRELDIPAGNPTEVEARFFASGYDPA